MRLAIQDNEIALTGAPCIVRGGNMRKLIWTAASMRRSPSSAGGRGGRSIVIKFSHVVASDTPKGKAADKFKEPCGENTPTAR